MSKLRLACSSCGAPWDASTEERPFAVPCSACHGVEEVRLDIGGRVLGRRTVTPGTGGAYPPAEDVRRMVQAMDPVSDLVPIARCVCGAPLLLDEGVKVEVICRFCSNVDPVRAADVPAKCDLGHLDVALPGNGLLRYRFAVRRTDADDVCCPWCDAPMDWEPGERACTKCGGAVGVGDDPRGLRSTAGVSVEGFDGQKNVRLALTPAAAERDLKERLSKAAAPARQARAITPPPAPASVHGFRPVQPPAPIAVAMPVARPAPAPQPAPPPAPAPAFRPAPVAATLAAPSPQPTRRSGGGAGIVIIAAVLVLFVSLLGSCLAFVFLSADQTTDDDVRPRPPPGSFRPGRPPGRPAGR